MKTAFLVDIAGDNEAINGKVGGKTFHVDVATSGTAGAGAGGVTNGVTAADQGQVFSLQELADAGCLHGQWAVPLEAYDAKRNTSSPCESKHHDRVAALLGRLRAASAKESAENGQLPD